MTFHISVSEAIANDFTAICFRPDCSATRQYSNSHVTIPTYTRL